VHYDLLVGADGAYSLVRGELQRKVMLPGFLRIFTHNMVYTFIDISKDAAVYPNHTFMQLHPGKVRCLR
jgi:2-polyprenyl-6-methoxyphenol hydroxylase-like FAD-dependent oxidoreductase